MSAFGSDPEALRRHGERFEFATAIRARALCAMTEIEAMAHAKDMLRTRVTPGADPRVGWDPSLRFSASGALYKKEPNDPKWYEGAPFSAPRIAWLTAHWKALAWSLRQRDRYRYVPCDVCRWRDPAHRAAMAERARRYATERVTYSRAV